MRVSGDLGVKLQPERWTEVGLQFICCKDTAVEFLNDKPQKTDSSKLERSGKMMEILLQVVSGMGGGALVVGLFKLLISHRMNKELERLKSALERESEEFKANLARDNEVLVAQLGAELHGEATKQIKGYEYLQTARFNETKSLYELMMKVIAAMESLISKVVFSGDPSLDERATNAESALNVFIQGYQKSRILYPSEICKNIDSLIDVYVKGYKDFISYRKYWNSKDPMVLREDREAREAATRRIHRLAPALVDKVIQELRGLIYVSSE